MSTLFLKTYPAPPVDRAEILRYAGMKSPTPDIDALLDACLEEALPKLSYRLVYTTLPVKAEGGVVDVGFAAVRSEALCSYLSTAKEAIFFAATVGLEPDRLIGKYGSIAPTKALLMQAIGAERIESLCDAFQRDARKEYGASSARFSPGYGDLPLTFQKEMFRLLDCPRKIGLTLNESLLMSPTKSVTAIIGMAEDAPKHSCEHCSLIQCEFRK